MQVNHLHVLHVKCVTWQVNARDFCLLELSKRKMLPEVLKSLCLGECLEGLSCLSQCRAITWSTVTPLNTFLKMQFSLDFLDVWGSLERMKRNFSRSDFDTLIGASRLIFCQFFWEAHLTEKSSPMRGEPFQDVPGILKVPGYQERFGRGRCGDANFPLCSDPFQFLTDPSWVCQACSCRSKQPWWKSSVPLKLNLCAEILFIGNFLVQMWGKNTVWNSHSSPNPVP